jgi:antitoxin (DNA-binding transcriptional repressor) of toxin-antitoxin stability system
MKPIVVGMHEAKTNFSKLVKEAVAGREVIVKNFDTPVAKIVAYTAPPKVKRTPGLMKGLIEIKPGFDDLPPGFEIFDE